MIHVQCTKPFFFFRTFSWRINFGRKVFSCCIDHCYTTEILQYPSIPPSRLPSQKKIEEQISFKAYKPGFVSIVLVTRLDYPVLSTSKPKTASDHGSLFIMLFFFALLFLKKLNFFFVLKTVSVFFFF